MTPASGAEVKSCCARLYETDLVQTLLGDSFHPGGERLTERLGVLLGLNPESHVLDIASGNGASALFLAEKFSCSVTGIDYGSSNVARANEAAAERSLARVRFLEGDAENLHFEDAHFDAVVCECAFCTFPDKPTAARQFARVLKPGGFVGLSDITRNSDLPDDLRTLLAYVACIGDAQPVSGYVDLLESAGLIVEMTENHDRALEEMTERIGLRLLAAEVMIRLEKLTLPGVDLIAANTLAKSALAAVRRGELGYSVLIASKPV